MDSRAPAQSGSRPLPLTNPFRHFPSGSSQIHQPSGCPERVRNYLGDGKPWCIGTEVYGDRDVISRKLSMPNAERIFFIRRAGGRRSSSSWNLGIEISMVIADCVIGNWTTVIPHDR